MSYVTVERIGYASDSVALNMTTGSAQVVNIQIAPTVLTLNPVVITNTESGAVRIGRCLTPIDGAMSGNERRLTCCAANFR